MFFRKEAILNQTIQTQLNHRSIRQFKDTPIAPEIIETLVDVARHTSSSTFNQDFSIISVTDHTKKAKIAELCKQPYVAQTAHLFILVLDLHRNHTIASEKGADTSVLQSADRFLSSATNTALAAQNMMIAAESLGLGGVFFGSILNDAQAMIDILELPHYTFPYLGIGFGYPDQDPQIKPRLPQNLMHFENTYQCFEPMVDELKAYDETVTNYYDLRNANVRVDSFTDQVTRIMGVKPEKRMKNLEVLHKQGFIKV